MPIARPSSLRPFCPRLFSLGAALFILMSLCALLPHAVAQSSSQPAPAGALQGVYAGVFQDHARLGRRFYYFTADGWVTNNIPAVNMDRFDINVYRNDPSNRLFVGRYRVDGNQVHIVWANDENRREIIKVNNAGTQPAIDTYIPTCRCDGKRFSGTYHWGNDERFLHFSSLEFPYA